MVNCVYRVYSILYIPHYKRYYITIRDIISLYSVCITFITYITCSTCKKVGKSRGEILKKSEFNTNEPGACNGISYLEEITQELYYKSYEQCSTFMYYYTK